MTVLKNLFNVISTIALIYILLCLTIASFTFIKCAYLDKDKCITEVKILGLTVNVSKQL